MAPKNKGKAPASSLAPSRALTARTITSTCSSAPPRGNYPHSNLPPVINKNGIVFVDDVQCEKYDAFVTLED